MNDLVKKLEAEVIDWKALADERGKMLHAASAHIEALEEEVTKLREWLKNIGSEIVLKGDFHITQVGMEDEK